MRPAFILAVSTLALSAAVTLDSHAQVVRGRVLNAADGGGIGGAMVTLVDPRGKDAP